MSSIMQIMSLPLDTGRVLDAVEIAGCWSFAAASACQIYLDSGSPAASASFIGGLTPTTILRVLGPSSAVGLRSSSVVYVA